MATGMNVPSVLVIICSLFTIAMAADKPNIVFIMADDLGWDDVSFHGSTQIPTPSIDTLAYDGVILNNYYVQPICTPSRAALMTGRHPIHLGLQTGVIMGSEPYGLSLKERLLPQYLKELGYATHMVGKWHIGYMSDEYTPTRRGFDSHYGYYGGCDDYYDHTYRDGRGKIKQDSWGLDFWHNRRPEKTAFGQYSTHLFTQKAEEIIDNHDVNKPLFLYLPHQAPHNGNGPSLDTSLRAPYEYVQRFSHIKDKHRRTYAAMVSVLDESIGNVTLALQKKGLLNNTIIAFSTDNGGPANGFSLNMACNEPLRGMKYTLWEGGVRANGFLWSPLLSKSGYVSGHMMQIFDWLPTLLHPAGYNLSKLPAGLDGLDLWDTLSQKKDTSPRKEMLLNIDDAEEHNYALRKGDLKIKSGGDQGYDGWFPLPTVEENASAALQTFASHTRLGIVSALRSIGRVAKQGAPVVIKCGTRPENYTTNCKPTEAPCLFNITADPCEYNNLAPSMPDVIQQLLTRVEAYNATASPIRNKPLDKNGLPKHHKGVWVPWLNVSEVIDIEREFDPEFSEQDISLQNLGAKN